MPRRSIYHDLYIIAGIVVSIVILVMSVVVALNRTYIVSRAAETGVSTGVFSKDNSYIFASPVSVVADSNSSIRITVFILDSQGLGVPNIKVDLQAGDLLMVKNVSPVTDNFGRATFDVTSGNPGDYKINAEASGMILSSQVSVRFR